MKILFIHQNMPGQFRYIARHLAQQAENEVVFLTTRDGVSIPGVRRIVYKPRREPRAETHHYLRQAERAILYGQETTRALIDLKGKGWRPDVVVGHPGWGEMLFLKEVYPDVPVLAYFEFFYRAHGTDVNFDPELPASSVDEMCKLRIKNFVNLQMLEVADAGLCPTRWQFSTYPEAIRAKTSVIFDGVDTLLCRPDAAATFTLPDGRVLSRSDEVVTYCTRAYEPYRGFPSFMRAISDLCRRRPHAHVLIVGGDGNAYGRDTIDGRSWKDHMLDEVAIDPDRVHFLGNLPWGQLHRVYQVSAAHVYLTYPFVLSWSMMEAMASGCAIVGSDTPPVREMIEDGVNGLLCDFFDPKGIADRVEEVLDHPDRMQAIRDAARRTILQRYELGDCMARQIALIRRLAEGERPLPPQSRGEPGAPAFGKPTTLPR